MEPKRHRVVIVGGGFSGLGVAIRLLKEGMGDFVILEKGSRLGGTWRDNTYPGCACDVPSQLYSFSFALNAEWGRIFAEHAEIQAYLEATAEGFKVTPHVRLDTELQEARWDDEAMVWRLKTSQGPYEAQVLVAGLGPLHEPRIPDLPGMDAFKGEVFHSARWRHDLALRGCKVAVVGTGSSAIQFVPEIQPEVAALTIFQRTASWVLPKPDHAIPEIEKAAFRHLPGFQRGFRAAIYGALELVQLAQRKPERMDRLSKLSLMHLERQVKDPALRRRLTPDFSMGCKRFLLSNTWYPAIQAPNVKLVSAGVKAITPGGLIGDDGVEVEADTIIFGTGFHATDPPAAQRVFGRRGRSLADTWQGSPQAYLGTTIADFPNLFFMIGPNLGNGHTSALILIEAQARYIADALRAMDRDGLASIAVRPAVQAHYNEAVQEALAGTVWNAGGCASWYIDKTGRNSSIYPWTTLDLRRRLSRFDVEHYIVRPAPRALSPRPRREPAPLALRGAVVAITGGAHGIGLAAAERFVQQGALVCLGDLDLAAARAAAAALGPQAHAFGLDVSRRASFAAFIDAVERQIGPIDVLVNNAGVMPAGSFLAEPDAAHAAAMGVNVWGVSLGMKLALPLMIARGRGHVVNVASLAGKAHIPGLATYVASKHAVVGLSAAVREEIEGTGVTLSTIMPGAVRTRLSQGIPLRNAMAIDPEDVARAIVDSVETRQAEIALPRALGALAIASPALPEPLVRWVRRKLDIGRVLTRADHDQRRAYERDIVAQGSTLQTTEAR